MSRPKILIFGVLFILGIVGVLLLRPPQAPSLSVLLFCAPGAQGELIIKRPAISSELKLTAAKACAEESITFKNYERNEPLSIIFQNNNSGSTNLELQETAAIQSGNDGHYYVIINILTKDQYIEVGAI